MRSLILWLVGGFLSVLSLLVLKSISPDLVEKQFWFFCGGWLSCWTLLQLPEVAYRRALPWMYWGLVVVLAVLLVIGDRTRGTTGWFEVGYGLKLQPSQFAVPVVIAFIVERLTAGGILVGRRLYTTLALVAIPGILILVEPDFGTGMVYFVTLIGVLVMYGLPKRLLVGSAMAGGIGLLLVWTVVFKQYQKERVLGFLQPTSDFQVQEESDAQYNARQALIAVGSGGFLGKGLGQGVQSHLRFLPERQTDFIFASLAEEMGFLGAVAVVTSYGVLIFWLVSWYSRTPVTPLLLPVGISVYFFIQSGINIGMNIGLLPITGITLPLLSYGGSSILATCMAFGLSYRQIRLDKPKAVVTMM